MILGWARRRYSRGPVHGRKRHSSLADVRSCRGPPLDRRLVAWIDPAFGGERTERCTAQPIAPRRRLSSVEKPWASVQPNLRIPLRQGIAGMGSACRHAGLYGKRMRWCPLLCLDYRPSEPNGHSIGRPGGSPGCRQRVRLPFRMERLSGGDGLGRPVTRTRRPDRRGRPPRKSRDGSRWRGRCLLNRLCDLRADRTVCIR